MSILHPNLIDNLNDLRTAFDNNEPFRHVEIPNFFQEDVLSRILQQFPVPKAEEMVNEFGVPNRKYACHDVRNIGPVYKEIDDYISGQEFANIMSELTGIRDLLYDPEYHGAGTHDNMSGQGMDPHVDFNFHRTTGYHRRLNAIIYLNDEWKEEWGGCLQVHKDPWDPANDWTKTYLPLKNRCVLFETNEYSWHGFTKVKHPTDPNISRKSFTIYMYTKERPVHEIGDKHGTIYVPRPMPDSIKPGRPLSIDEYEDIKQLIGKRTGMIKGMYEREMKQNNVIKSLMSFRDNFQLPIEGFVRQVGGASGVHGNFGVMKSFEFKLRSIKTLSSFSFSFKIPPYLDGQSVEVLINGIELASFKSNGGKIEGAVAFEMESNDTAEFAFKFARSQSAHAARQGSDKREVSGFIERLRCE